MEPVKPISIPGDIGQPDDRPTRPLKLRPPLPRPPSISPAQSDDNKFVYVPKTKVVG